MNYGKKPQRLPPLRAAALVLLPLLLMAFATPPPYSNQAALYYDIGLLYQHEALRPCVQWMSDNGVRIIPRPLNTIRRGNLGWGALRPDIILTPPFIPRGAVAASHLFHEIKHLQGVSHPDVYNYQMRTAKLLGVPESHLAWIVANASRFPDWVPRVVPLDDLCVPTML